MQNSSEKFCVGILLSAFFCVFFIPSKTLAAAGSLDPTFDGDGIVVSNVGTEDRAFAMVLQPDGKIVVGGRSRENRSYPDFALVRYNADGSLDPTFGNGGEVITFIQGGGAWQEINALALQPDGKIVAVGSLRTTSGALTATGVARYNPNGSLDPTFGTGGVAIVDHGVDRAVILQPDGKIVSGGGGGSSALSDFQISRLNADGSPDTTFDGDGHLIIDFNGSGDGIYGLALQPDGKIVAVGRSRTAPSDGTSDNFAVARILSNGILDTTFSGDGKVTTDFATLTDVGFAVALQPDGKIVVAGQAMPQVNDWDFGLVRYNADGSLDTSFDGDGKVLTPFGVVDGAFAVKIQRNGKIVAAGKHGEAVGSPAALARYNPNGSLDTTFGGGGKVSTFLYFNDDFRALEIQPDGKILAAGTANGGEIIGKFAVARFTGDPVVNQNTAFDFEGDGKTDVSIFRPANGEWWILKSSNGSNAAFQFGAFSDKLVPADFTGDGKSDVAVWRPSTGEWFVLRSENSSYYSFPFGTSGDIPSVGDFDSDGKADATVFRPSNSTWFILRSTGGTLIQQFGQNGDSPVVADYDGDGKSDIAIYRASAGEWWIQRSTAGLIAYTFGNGTDKAVQGDYTGDGKADAAIWRGSTGEWFILRSEDASYYAAPFGVSTDIAAPGDFDGDGKFDLAVFRPSDATWYMLRSTAGFSAQQFGLSSDTPIPNAFVR